MSPITDDALPEDEDVQAGDRNDVDAVTDLPVEEPTGDQAEEDEDLGEESDVEEDDEDEEEDED